MIRLVVLLVSLMLSAGPAVAQAPSTYPLAETADEAVRLYTGIGMHPWRRMTTSQAGELGTCHWYGNGHYSCLTLACINGVVYIGLSAPTKRQNETYNLQVNKTSSRALHSATFFFRSLHGSRTIYTRLPFSLVDHFLEGAKVYVTRHAAEALIEEFPLSQFQRLYPDFTAACDARYAAPQTAPLPTPDQGPSEEQSDEADSSDAETDPADTGTTDTDVADTDVADTDRVDGDRADQGDIDRRAAEPDAGGEQGTDPVIMRVIEQMVQGGLTNFLGPFDQHDLRRVEGWQNWPRLQRQYPWEDHPEDYCYRSNLDNLYCVDRESDAP